MRQARRRVCHETPHAEEREALDEESDHSQEPSREECPVREVWCRREHRIKGAAAHVYRRRVTQKEVSRSRENASKKPCCQQLPDPGAIEVVFDANSVHARHDSLHLAGRASMPAA